MDSAGADGLGGHGRADRRVGRRAAADRRARWLGHTEAELGLLVERARQLLDDPGQGEFELAIERASPKARLIGPPAELALFAGGAAPAGKRPVVAAPRVISTDSRVLFDALSGVFTALRFDALGDPVFRDLVVARIVEPTSILGAGRVLADLGRKPASEKTMRRTLTRCQE